MELDTQPPCSGTGALTMKTMESKEVQEHFSELLREIEETGQPIGVSDGGKLVAQLVPTRAPQQQTKRDPREAIAELEALIAEITPDLPDTVNVEEIINDIRR
jgi:antitoxin (DNA-binding transcriptional repressor) of toxin-antitoxin stability system